MVLWVLLAVRHASAQNTLPDGFIEVSVGGGWSEPVGIVFDPAADSRAYVWERSGKVWVLEDGVKLPTPLIDLSEEVGSWRDHGLLGFALHPNFGQNGYVYLFYTVDRHHLLNFGTPNYDPEEDEYSNATIARITRYTAQSSDSFRSVDPASRKVLVGETKATGFPVLFESHGVGSLVFGTDGTLLVSFGDSGSFNGVDDGGGDGGSYSVQALADGILKAKEDVGAFRAQLIDSLCGKLLRIDPNTGDGIPSNPFYDAANPRSARSRVWALGLRNPFRFTIRPGTGSHNVEDANPGVIVVGDVGWGSYEEFSVIDAPGQNLGWPLYEGLTERPMYFDSPARNLDAPNPFGNYFKFSDLLVQDTLGTPSWPNPSQPSQQIPASIPKFVHRRPFIDIGREDAPVGPARTGTFNGNTATVTNIGPGAPITGDQFKSLCAIGGTFYEGGELPETYHGTYFCADFDLGWIRNVVFDANHRPTAIREFATVFRPTYLTSHAGSLYYVSIGAGIRQIVYAPGGNRLPIAAASVDQVAGASPLTVTFSSAGSSDPDGGELTYHWDFGDGTESTEANPTKTFTFATTKRFDVVLTVTDEANGTAQATVAVFVNHQLPEVEIVSPVDGGKYPIDATKTYALVRRVTEAPGHPTTTSWQVFLHHNTHQHADPPIVAPAASAVISPAYGDGAIYFYRILLTVTDDLGASVQREVRLYPNAENLPPVVNWGTTTIAGVTGSAAAILSNATTVSDPDSPLFDFGRITITSSGGIGDTLTILPDGGADGIGLNQGALTFAGLPVGTVSGGTGGVPLVIDFLSTATPEITQAILRRVAATFTLGGTRTISAMVEDGDGGASAAAELQVEVTGIPNMSPTVQLDSPANGASFPSGTPIPFSATADDADGAIDRVEYIANGTVVGSATAEPFTFQWTGALIGDYSVKARAYDDFGASVDSDAITISVVPDVVLPGQWTAADLGVVGAEGSVDYQDGIYSLTASGAGIGAGKDAVLFVSQQWTGDGEIIARVNSVEELSPNSFGGIMFREKSTPGARFALLKATAGKGLVFQRRTKAGAAPANTTVAGISAPRWLRLVRHGLRCTAYSSVNGTDWLQVGSASVPMGKAVLVGLVASSAKKGETGDYVFDQVTVRGLTTPANPTVSISSPANGASFVLPVTVSIDVKANDPDGGVARVELFNGTKKKAIDNKPPFAFSWAMTKPGTYTIGARAVDFAGLKTDAAPVEITVSAATNGLSAPWNSRDIGPTPAGGNAVEAEASFTITSTGRGLGSTADQGRIVYRPCTGNFTLTARVASLSDADPNSFAGIMLREGLGPAAKNVTFGVTAGNGTALHWRAAAGGKSKSFVEPARSAPGWLRLVRRGNQFTASYSEDGVEWVAFGSGPKTIAFGASCYAGFIVGAANPEEECAAVFEEISLTKP